MAEGDAARRDAASGAEVDGGIDDVARLRPDAEAKRLFGRTPRHVAKSVRLRKAVALVGVRESRDGQERRVERAGDDLRLHRRHSDATSGPDGLRSEIEELRARPASAVSCA